MRNSPCTFSRSVTTLSMVFATILAFTAIPIAQAQVAESTKADPAITIAKPLAGTARASVAAQSAVSPAPYTIPSNGAVSTDGLPSVSASTQLATLNPRAADYREFAQAKVGAASTETFTLNFHQSTTLKSITATADFHVIGGTCMEGHAYSEGNVCSVDVAFQPSGAGHRTGQLSIAHSASVKPMLTPIGGTAYVPVVSFIPSQINTVPGTYSSGGTLSNPKGLGIDGGDTLYIADTGNNLIKKIDSSGTIKNLIGGGSSSLLTNATYGLNIALSSPYGVAVDYSGVLNFTDQGDNLLGAYFADTDTQRKVGGGTSSTENYCTPSSPCSNPAYTALNPPASIAIDPSGNVFFSTLYGRGYPGVALAEYLAASNPTTYYDLGSTAYNYYSQSYAIGVDPYGYENVYYTYNDPGTGILSSTPLCSILGQNSAYSQDTAGPRFWTVAGSSTCGFSGDGGKATGAEISGSTGAFAWDAAGNFYFTDTGNNRVRRVDGSTGLIYTVAGNGSVGFGGDGGPATSATLNTPFGLAVDSLGRVYVTNVTSSPKTEIRVIGTTGVIAFGSTNVSAASAVKTILLSNTGNATLNFTRATISGSNASDFAIDPNTTSCNFSASLASGKSCSIGVIFTPSAAGSRSSLLTVLDDTVAGSNLVQLTGTGASANPAVAALAPTSEVFNAEPVGTPSGTRTLTLSNTGGASLTISSIAITGANATDFTQTNTCGTTLAASATCSISVIFQPAAAGARSATLSVATNVSTVTAALTGTGTSAAATVSVTPNNYSFGNQTVGTSSAIQKFTLTNGGTTTATINSYTFSGANVTDFIQAHNCTATLAAAATCTVNIVFKPSATGLRTATLTISTTSGSVAISIAGNAVAASAKPAVTLTSSANPAIVGHTLTLMTRIGGNQPIRVIGLAVSESSAAQSSTTSVSSRSGLGSTRPQPVQPVRGGAQPTGNVQLLDGATVVAEGTLINGSVSFNLKSLSAGTHMLTASYLGDSQHQPSESNPLKQIVSNSSAVSQR